MTGPSQARPDAARPFASPLARAIARQRGLDLAGVRGSGPLGRIVKADVTSRLAAAGAGVVAGSVAGESGAGVPYDELVNPIGRKLIARRLTESKQQAPHFYARIDCCVDRVAQMRAAWAPDQGPKPSINDFVIHAAARALRSVPAVNASYTEAAIRRYRRVHIAVAVAVEDGLATPVIEDADLKTVGEIARAMQVLVVQARAGALPSGAARGGTFSVSNLGGFGVREFTAVINPPQSAILAVGAAEPRAVVRGGAVAVATMMSVVLSCDHRAIDGATAARWLAAFRAQVEQPQPAP